MAAADAASDDDAPAGAAPPAAADAVGPAAPDPRDAELAALRDRVARARADYDNLQKRVARDAVFERERAKARVLEAILPVHELAQMAAHQAEHHPGPLSDGVVLMAREFGRLLEREGLVPTASVGVPFDRALHEAVAEEAAAGVPPGHVSRVVQAGYRLGDKVMRYAKVAVAPASSTASMASTAWTTSTTSTASAASPSSAASGSSTASASAPAAPPDPRSDDQ